MTVTATSRGQAIAPERGNVTLAKKLKNIAIATIAAIGTAFVAAGPASAVDPGAAKSFVQATAQQIIRIAAGGGSTRQKAASLQRVLNSRADVARIARYTVGRKWRQMSSSQKSRYRSAIIPYIAARFAKSFDGFRGGSLTVRSSTPVKRGSETRVVVKSIGRRANGGAATDIQWEIASRNGRPIVLDVKVENLSLVIQQRQEINGLLNGVGGDFDKLIAKLRASTAS